ncbi:cytochrome P450 monooxygenase [Fusarium tjaetaba]|uniref:Cytochrome P450 monooxygenase n=1 Tax=Fusarium tjaetaba TaxID=1567544 RepID=A0A8H5QKL7_9HYPO|nr:cytochrome P450 monooxygenase [Fusarium tjaetaba]KAF5617651.1 cytochrome P450 monooxygenase [Fusarium tjaetaba]
MDSLKFVILPPSGFCIISILALIALYAVTTTLLPGLRSLPGPYLAKFTDGWRLYKVYCGNYEQTIIELHQRYGDIVRIGPNAVSIADPAALESIYGLKANYRKSKFYNAFMQMNKGKPVESFFTTQNISWHSAIKRPVSSAYSMTTLTDYEPHVNEVINQLIEQLTVGYCSDINQVQVCPIASWIHFFSFDVIAKMTWSDTIGFLESGEDVDGMIRTMESDMDYFATVGQMPWVDNLIRKNPVARYVIKKTSNSAKFGLDKIQQRREKTVLSSDEQTDFLSKFLKAAKANPQLVDDQAIVSYMVTNLVAGSDTTAISIRAVLYYLLKTPSAYKRLRDEIDQASLPEGPVSWADSQKLPYLNACIKEAFRMHPAVGVPLERLTQSGYKLPNGVQVPEGTIVGISAWVIHRNTKIFGEQVDQYVPERWLQQPGESISTFDERIKQMKRADMTFGRGSRTCLGKNIGMMETCKAVPTLLKAFDISLVDPEKEWRLRNSWFVRQEGIEVYLKKRSK